MVESKQSFDFKMFDFESENEECTRKGLNHFEGTRSST